MTREIQPTLADARARALAGASTDDVLAHLHARGVSPMDAIRIIRNVFGLSMREAKIALDRHEAWRFEVAASERIRRQALDEVTRPLFDALPGEYRDLASWLDSAGFVLSESRESPAFGDRSLIVSRPPLEVRFVSDRGLWTLGLRHERWRGHDWFEPDVWIAHLDGAEVPADGLPRAEEAQIVRDRLEEIVAELLARPRAELLFSLRSRQEERILRGLGLPEGRSSDQRRRASPRSEMTLDEMRQAMEEYWRRVDAEAETSKDSQLALDRLESLYRRFDGDERALADVVVSEWLVSDDDGRRFDAEVLIDRCRIVSAAPALRRLARKLETSAEPGAPFERDRVDRLLAALAHAGGTRDDRDG